MSTTTSIAERMNEKILIMDGAMGTMLQRANLSADDFGGEELDGCNENLNLTRPDVIQKIHQQYLEAGADIIETNTFGATRIVLDEYGLGSKAYEINKVAAEIARNAADSYHDSLLAEICCRSNGSNNKNIKCYGRNYF